MVAILYNGGAFELSISLQQQAPCEIWWNLAKQFQRGTTLKDYLILYLYIAQGQGLIIRWGEGVGNKILIVTKTFYKCTIL